MNKLTVSKEQINYTAYMNLYELHRPATVWISNELRWCWENVENNNNLTLSDFFSERNLCSGPCNWRPTCLPVGYSAQAQPNRL